MGIVGGRWGEWRGRVGSVERDEESRDGGECGERV